MQMCVCVCTQLHTIKMKGNKSVELKPNGENSLATLIGLCHSSHPPWRADFPLNTTSLIDLLDQEMAIISLSSCQIFTNHKKHSFDLIFSQVFITILAINDLKFKIFHFQS